MSKIEKRRRMVKKGFSQLNIIYWKSVEFMTVFHKFATKSENRVCAESRKLATKSATKN